MGLKVIKMLLIAKYLGPELLGLWGILFLIQEYLQYTHLGTPYSLNVELSLIEKRDNFNRYINASLSFVIILSFFLGILAIIISLLNINLILNYRLNDFLFYVLFWGLVQVYFVFLKTIYRVQQRLFLINISESIVEMLPLLLLVFGSKFVSIYSLIIFTIIGFGFAVILLQLKLNINFKLSFDSKLINELIKFGVPLLLSNIFFYLIIQISKTYVSIFYPIKEMGYFSFSISLIMASLLGIKALQWAITPRLINKFYKMQFKNEILRYIQTIENVNSIFIFSFVYLVFLLLPLFWKLYPEYINSNNTILILILGNVFVIKGLGYNSLILAKKKQNKLIFAGAKSFILVLFFGIMVTKYLKAKIDILAIIIMISYILYYYSLVGIVNKIIEKDKTTTFRNAMLKNLTEFIPIIILLAAIYFIEFYYYLTAFSLIFYIVFNLSVLNNLIKHFRMNYL
ncbi:MAG: hypothetical protein CMF23_11025 [Ignavibacteriae bacterium]|nr:hypothetical protein [Ignavibacteriota bacterium]